MRGGVRPGRCACHRLGRSSQHAAAAPGRASGGGGGVDEGVDDALAEWLAVVAGPMQELRALLRQHHQARGAASSLPPWLPQAPLFTHATISGSMAQRIFCVFHMSQLTTILLSPSTTVMLCSGSIGERGQSSTL